ncbi:hypothetical protein, partial [Streptomyces sp. NPDC007070]|uniref:hypothetical protein n=1 Tax=Streptomyces sp. NPDC007070 TaxID=3154312 RepID=UPI0033D12B64
DITAANSPEGGAVFTLRLPRDASALTERPAEDTAVRWPVPPSGTGRVIGMDACRCRRRTCGARAGTWMRGEDGRHAS